MLELVNPGINCFVVKPLDVEKFLYAMNQACKRIKQERDIANFYRKLEQLCKAALEKNIESDFIKETIRLHNITPGSYKNENWPYPLKIYTLGRFAIAIDNEFVNFSGKIPRKPLEMLKAIIALGGRDVGITQLSESLWPNADLAATSFHTTLHRLRKLLCVDYDVIITSDSYVSVNSDYCWIDMWSLWDIIDEFKHRCE
ncbi:MAG: hypothetical protein HQK89_09365 [Nitrospirae bacterium]|nr:hypothetical protein [Nitrospirota bacterium]